jgi:hypothetical protein
MSWKAFSGMLKSKRFWTWEIAGAAIYAIPAPLRLATGNIHLPILSMFVPFWVSPFVPGNIVEKILVNAFFPGGAGAVAGEVYFTKKNGVPTSKKQKYLRRLAGAWAQTAAWSLFQFIGYYQYIIGSYGDNLFEAPVVFPLNFTLAALSIFTPDVLGILKKAFWHTNAKP